MLKRVRIDGRERKGGSKMVVLLVDEGIEGLHVQQPVGCVKHNLNNQDVLRGE